MRYNTILFDLDGTILYTYAFHRKAFRRFFTKYWRFSDGEDITPFMSNTMKEMYEKMGVPTEQRVGLQTRLHDFYRREADDLIDELTVPVEMIEVLKTVRENGARTALLSNSSEAFVFKLIEKKGMGDFFDIVSGMGQDMGDKMDRGIALIDTLPNPQKMIYIGDTPADMEMACRAGIDSLLLYTPLSWMYPYDYTAVRFAPVYVCFRQTEILSVL